MNKSITITTPSDITIDHLIDLAHRTLAPTSQRVYQATYNKWLDWCHNQDINPLHLSPDKIFAFLTAHHVTKKTRQRQLSAMVKLLDMLYIATGDDSFQRVVTYLQKTKVPEANLSDAERDKHALTPEQVHKVLTAWDFDDKPLNIRNRSIVSLTFAIGARRSEIARLEWRDIDFDEATCLIRHGKGDKSRTSAIVGDLAMQHLADWRVLIPGHRWTYCPMTHAGTIGEDKPISGQTIYHLIKRTQTLSDVDLTPHTGRRTFITEALAQGAPMSDVQAQVGHADPAMTLRYAQAADARTRRSRIKLRYGS